MEQNVLELEIGKEYVVETLYNFKTDPSKAIYLGDSPFLGKNMAFFKKGEGGNSFEGEKVYFALPSVYIKDGLYVSVIDPILGEEDNGVTIEVTGDQIERAWSKNFSPEEKSGLVKILGSFGEKL